MFAPKVANPQTKAAEHQTSKRARQRSPFAARPLSGSVVQQALVLQRSGGNQAQLRLLAQRATNFTGIKHHGDNEKETDPASLSTRAATSGVSWDFSKVPLYPTHPADRPQARSSLSEPPPQGIFQAKLAVGKVNDPLEYEADRVAEQVMHMPDPPVSPGTAPQTLLRKCTACEEAVHRKCAACGEEDEKLQKKGDGSASPACEAPPIVHEVLRTPGQPLDATTRAFFEPRFGSDFSQVRVHTDTLAARSAVAVSAIAYTTGSHIAFAPGHYEPGSAAGSKLLAHELAHVVQQGGILPRGANLSTDAAHPTIRRESSSEGVIRRVGCTDLANPKVTEAVSISEKEVQGPLAAQIPGSVRELPIPTGSFAPYREKRFDPGQKRSGTGLIDIALTRPPTLEILEVKRAGFVEIADGITQLVNYVEKGNADENADWRAKLGVTDVLPMPTSRFTGTHVRTAATSEPITLQWCSPGLIAFKAIREQDKDIFVCAGRDQGKIDAFLRPKLNQAFDIVDEHIDKTVGPKIEAAVQSMPLGRAIEKLLQSPSAKALLEKALGPGTGRLIDLLDAKMLGDLAEKELGQLAPLIRAVALDLVHRVLAQVKRTLHDKMLNILQAELNALCATVAVLTLEDLLKQLRNNLPKYFGEAVAVAIPIVVQQLIQELLKEIGIAFLKALAIVAGTVLAILAIVEIAAAAAVIEIGTLIEGAIAAIVRALASAGVFALNTPNRAVGQPAAATPDTVAPPTAVAAAGPAGGATATPVALSAAEQVAAPA